MRRSIPLATLLGANAAYGVGGLLGIGVFRLVVDRFSRPTVWRTSYVAYAVSFGLLALPGLPLLAVVLVLMGVTSGAVDPMERLLRQERTPPELRGRVFATMLAANRIATPISVFGAGLLLESLGLRPTLLVFAVGNTAITLGLLVAASLNRRKIDAHNREVGATRRDPAESRSEGR